MPQSAITYRSGRHDVPLSVTEVGRQTVRSLISDRTMMLFAAVLVERGAGMFASVPSGRLFCTAPALFWIVPGIEHSYGPDPGDSWDERWVIFRGPLAEQFRTQRLIDPVTPLVPLPGGSDVAALFRDLESEVQMRSSLGDAAAAATVARLVTRAAIEAELRTPRRLAGDAEMIAALRERALGPIDLAAFANEFGMSPATLRRRFVAATGVAPKVLQLRMRIDRAKELLATTELSIEQIAGSVGFDDAFYFARLFLRREKLTPSEFRRRNHRH